MSKDGRELPLKERFRTLTGRYFIAHVRLNAVHSMRECGFFIGVVSSGIYSVRFINPDGTNGREELVPAIDMRQWRVFETQEEMEAELRK